LTSLLQQQLTKEGGQVPDYTLNKLQEFTANPSVAAKFFPELAAPLLEANRVSQERQTGLVQDAFRKAGGTGGGALQAGAFAQAGRQLGGDFARQDQEALAKAYIPLTAQLSENTNNAIRAGLALPEAQAASYRNLVPLLTGLQPLQTRTQTTGVTAPISSPGGAITPEQQQQQLAYQQAGYANLGGGAGSIGSNYYG
jgi:hypothetical protein